MQILFLGPQGSGKGTQSKKLAEVTKLPLLCSGDLLRQTVADGTPAGNHAKEFMDAGKLVPDDVLIEMFEEKLTSPQCSKGFILDGFPRNLAQAKALDGLLAKVHLPLNHVISLEIDDRVATERMTGRRICSNKSCGAIYHVKFSPPKHDLVCDLCGSPLIQRSDDTEEASKERLRIYHDETKPLTNYYGAKHLLSAVDAEADAGAVFLNISGILKLEPSKAQ
jgi:adenylate kinase